MSLLEMDTAYCVTLLMNAVVNTDVMHSFLSLECSVIYIHTEVAILSRAVGAPGHDWAFKIVDWTFCLFGKQIFTVSLSIICFLFEWHCKNMFLRGWMGYTSKCKLLSIAVDRKSNTLLDFDTKGKFSVCTTSCRCCISYHWRVQKNLRIRWRN